MMRTKDDRKEIYLDKQKERDLTNRLSRHLSDLLLAFRGGLGNDRG